MKPGEVSPEQPEAHEDRLERERRQVYVERREEELHGRHLRQEVEAPQNGESEESGRQTVKGEQRPPPKADAPARGDRSKSGYGPLVWVPMLLLAVVYIWHHELGQVAHSILMLLGLAPPR